jgi:hypothetical protein
MMLSRGGKLPAPQIKLASHPSRVPFLQDCSRVHPFILFAHVLVVEMYNIGMLWNHARYTMRTVRYHKPRHTAPLHLPLLTGFQGLLTTVSSRV